MFTAKAAFSGISVDNMAKAKQFYTQTLGLTTDSEDMGLSYNCPAAASGLLQKEGHQPASFTVLNFEVDDIDKAVEELSAAGVSFEKYDNIARPARRQRHNAWTRR